MNYNIGMGVLVACAVASCSPSGHNDEHQDEHSEEKVQYTAYTANLELFAKADPFIVGEKAQVESFVTLLPDFKALDSCSVTVALTVNGKEIAQTSNQPERKGVYHIEITPNSAGQGTLTYTITNTSGIFVVVVPNVEVYANDEAHEAAEHHDVSKTNTTVFSKEQSWKIDFATAHPRVVPFGQSIKTTALVQSAQGNELVISANTNGIVLFNSGTLLEGNDVTAGQALFSVSGGAMADNNITVKYAEAKSNYEKATADYERAKTLAQDNIVSAKDLLSAKNQYENAKAVYNNLNRNVTTSGQSVTSPQTGFITQVFVKNGAYVEAGQPVAVVSQNKSLVLSANVSSKYAAILPNIKTANIKTINDNRTYSLEQLHGKVISFGKAANSDNYLIPIALQVENNGSFVAGSYVEVYLITFSNTQALVVPTTSLIEEQGNFFVWVQVTPELFEKREVFIGGTDGMNTEIIKGITASERIVTRGAMLIKLAQATGSLDAHSGHVH